MKLKKINTNFDNYNFDPTQEYTKLNLLQVIVKRKTFN